MEIKQNFKLVYHVYIIREILDELQWGEVSRSQSDELDENDLEREEIVQMDRQLLQPCAAVIADTCRRNL